ncbi:hypothetical protein DICVIV_09650 [Dictyocaulus viviparus]|uniref:Uncharacterized protein n=1 Tax=Dictyocaulus viviparus TaxID=29172 RepID=A0A0D8XKJ4_DICVI|nr:hypothetical protein DICVIV_09650 [Dictyocaulus viviparus]
MLLRLCSVVMVYTILALLLHSTESEHVNDNKNPLNDPFEFDLYDEPSENSEAVFTRMETLCARLHNREPLLTDQKTSPLVYRLCDLLK